MPPKKTARDPTLLEKLRAAKAAARGRMTSKKSDAQCSFVSPSASFGGDAIDHPNPPTANMPAVDFYGAAPGDFKITTVIKVDKAAPPEAPSPGCYGQLGLAPVMSTGVISKEGDLEAAMTFYFFTPASIPTKILPVGIRATRLCFPEHGDKVERYLTAIACVGCHHGQLEQCLDQAPSDPVREYYSALNAPIGDNAFLALYLEISRRRRVILIICAADGSSAQPSPDQLDITATYEIVVTENRMTHGIFRGSVGVCGRTRKNGETGCLLRNKTGLGRRLFVRWATKAALDILGLPLDKNVVVTGVESFRKTEEVD
jgi:hypothetical protein